MAKVTFADSVVPSFGIPWRPVLTREHVKDWDTERLARYIKIRKETEAGAVNNPVGQGWSLPMWELVMENWTKYQNIVILGGNRCLDGDTPLYDPVARITRTIEQWASIGEPMHVQSMTTAGIQSCPATAPFAKGVAPLWELLLSDGRRIRCASEHRFLTPSGWLPLSRLAVGCSLVSASSHRRSMQDISREAFRPDAPCYSRTLPSYQARCSSDSRLYGEPPRPGEAAGQVSVQPQDGARKRSRLFGWDGLDDKASHTSIYPHRISFLPSTLGYSAPSGDFGSQCETEASWSKSVTWKPRTGQQFLFEEGVHPSTCDEDFFPSSDLLEGCFGQYSCVTISSITPLPVEVYYDITVPIWANYIACGLVHHNSSKSIFASRLCLWAGATIPESEVRCYHVNEDRSIQDQQCMIYDALPAQIKALPTKKGLNHSLTWSQKNGFTDNICILPPLPGYRKGGSLKFGNYRQYQQDAQIIEGFKAHVAWCDEECPQKMFETLQYRMVDFHGRIILTFTTLNGWTPLVQDILGKTRTLKTKAVPEWAVPKLGRTPLPIMQESLSRPGTVIYYFWTEDNAFIDTSDFVAKIKDRPKDEILARAFGIPTKSITGVFPGFNKETNVIPHEKLPWLPENLKKDKNGKVVPYKVTRYMSIDPAGSKAWFLLWVAVDALGTWWVYDEWPDQDDWALPGSTPEGKPGPAQKGQKKGILDYVEIMKTKEGSEEVFERFIDPRAGASEKQIDEGATNIIMDLARHDITAIPASGIDIESGLQLINNLLAWDDSKPKDSLNSPKLFISDRCQNLIQAMTEYNLEGGRNCAWKDPADCLRYLAVSDIQFIDTAKITDKMAYGTTGSY